MEYRMFLDIERVKKEDLFTFCKFISPELVEKSDNVVITEFKIVFNKTIMINEFDEIHRPLATFEITLLSVDYSNGYISVTFKFADMQKTLRIYER